MMTHHELRITNYASRTTQYAIMLLALVLASCTSAQEPSPRILAVEPAGVQVARYEKLELTIALEAAYDNPYDARVGHCNAFDVMSYGWDANKGFTLFDRMAEHGENTLVYWPIYSNPFFATRYDHYSLPDLKVIDLVVEDAARKSIYLVFTVWGHGLLRDSSHPWGNGLWETHNGFRALGSLDSFFTSAEAWAWQEDLYRYFTARWGYSPAIQTQLHRRVWHQRRAAAPGAPEQRRVGRAGRRRCAHPAGMERL
jgi:hypothetical protein